MNEMKNPAGLCAVALIWTALGSGVALIGGCEYICSECTNTSATTSSEPESVPAATATEKIVLEFEPALDGDADMRFIQTASIDSSHSSR